MIHTIKINHNSYCWGELCELHDLIKHNKGYTFDELTDSDIVAIAINELFDRLQAERNAGDNQR